MRIELWYCSEAMANMVWFLCGMMAGGLALALTLMVIVGGHGKEHRHAA